SASDRCLICKDLVRLADRGCAGGKCERVSLSLSSRGGFAELSHSQLIESSSRFEVKTKGQKTQRSRGEKAGEAKTQGRDRSAELGLAQTLKTGSLVKVSAKESRRLDVGLSSRPYGAGCRYRCCRVLMSVSQRGKEL